MNENKLGEGDTSRNNETSYKSLVRYQIRDADGSDQGFGRGSVKR